MDEIGKVDLFVAIPLLSPQSFGGCPEGFNYSQGGVEVPTGGKFQQGIEKARERLVSLDQGQQIWCNSKADGYSPDERG